MSSTCRSESPMDVDSVQSGPLRPVFDWSLSAKTIPNRTKIGSTSHSRESSHSKLSYRPPSPSPAPKSRYPNPLTGPAIPGPSFHRYSTSPPPLVTSSYSPCSSVLPTPFASPDLPKRDAPKRKHSEAPLQQTIPPIQEKGPNTHRLLRDLLNETEVPPPTSKSINLPSTFAPRISAPISISRVSSKVPREGPGSETGSKKRRRVDTYADTDAWGPIATPQVLTVPFIEAIPVLESHSDYTSVPRLIQRRDSGDEAATTTRLRVFTGYAISGYVRELDVETHSRRKSQTSVTGAPGTGQGPTEGVGARHPRHPHSRSRSEMVKELCRRKSRQGSGRASYS
ncbi:hypothetical protein DFP72DRAFT_532073 [Ephemerocybe angulata]|uniref:Uncharacterized protein n=1 Tax=Ephemerocybe angulata TaxID=980116 RepID=A0A8H6LZG9_9AGAR|nr:hypothetical protein DFP72DRAFT_532073 [Tulosesus angulatus]